MKLTLFILIAMAASSYGSERKKELNFEDDLIEGINRKPLDSVSQISEKNDDEHSHLYRKRASFSD